VSNEPGRDGGAEARRVLEDGLAARVYPGAVAEAGTSRGVLWRHAIGRFTYDSYAPDVSAGTIYDLASLTKVIAATTTAMRLVARGRLDVDRPVRDAIRAWRSDDRRAVSVRDLLEHASGLPASAPLPEVDDDRRRDVCERVIAECPLICLPRSASTYSDLGFILLGFILEDAGGAPLDELFDPIASELGLSSGDPLLFLPPRTWRGRIAPTRLDARRGLLIGSVDDDNAWALGGVAAHAGLFGTAAAVGVFAQRILGAIETTAPGAALVEPGVLKAFLKKSKVPGSSRALGWDTMLPTSSCGTRLSASAFGHTGFTGTSLWIDPARDLYAVLLTNRVHPVPSDGEGIRAVRRAFHDAVVGGMAS
jgi:serine-type D-Ala-D-Ala carboxypeptidase